MPYNTNFDNLVHAAYDAGMLSDVADDKYWLDWRRSVGIGEDSDDQYDTPFDSLLYYAFLCGFNSWEQCRHKISKFSLELARVPRLPRTIQMLVEG